MRLVSRKGPVKGLVTADALVFRQPQEVDERPCGLVQAAAVGWLNHPEEFIESFLEHF